MSNTIVIVKPFIIDTILRILLTNLINLPKYIKYDLSSFLKFYPTDDQILRIINVKYIYTFVVGRTMATITQFNVKPLYRLSTFKFSFGNSHERRSSTVSFRHF